MHKALETTRSQLAQWANVAQLGTFATALAHEIRNPLNTIMWSVDELGEVDVPKSVRRTLRLVDRNAERIEEIVEGILKFARQDLGGARRVQVGPLVR